MAAPERSLVWDDILDLAATLSGVARVRRRFLSYGRRSDVPSASEPRGRDGHWPERATALARAGLYNFLAASFGEPPSDEYVGTLWESGAIHLLVSKGLGGEGLRAWGQALRPDRLALELSTAYSQAFLRAGAQRAPLLASNYPVAALPVEAPAAMTLSHGAAAEAVEAAAQVVVRTGKPLKTSVSTPEYRRDMLRVFTRRALTKLWTSNSPRQAPFGFAQGGPGGSAA